MSIKLKYCGLTSRQDVLAAAESGADAVGFVLVKKSPRYLPATHATELVRLAKAHQLQTVALFADQEAGEVQTVQQQIQADVLQFHGSENVAYCEQFGMPYWKAIPMLGVTDWLAYAQRYASATYWLLDACGGGRSGGSGEVFDWFPVPQKWRERIILAGGIDAGNVARAIGETGATYIDTSSGIETAPGVKSKEKMLAMAKLVKQLSGATP